MKAKVITDTISNLPKELAEELGIGLVPLNVIIERNGKKEEQFQDIEKTPDYVYDRLVKEEYSVTTSQASPGEFMRVYNAAFDEGADKLLVLTITALKSGIYNSARLGARSFGEDVVVLDSKQATGAEALLAIRAAQYLETGNSFEETVERMQAHIEDEDVRFWACLQNMKYLHKSGRLPKPLYLVLSALSVKPFLTLEQGEIGYRVGIKTDEGATNHLFELMEKDGLEPGHVFNGFILHAMMPETAKELEHRILGSYRTRFLETVCVGTGFGVHVGPSVFGVAYWKRNAEVPQ